MDPAITYPFFIGTSNIVLPVANKAAFPEAFQNSSRLTYYASLFNSLEVNSSFYKIPLAKTVARWAAEVPDGFRFTFKMYKEVTHNKSMTCDPALIAHFIQTIGHVGEKKGALLVQFPASIQYSPVYLKRLLSLIQKDNDGWGVCVEFRHSSWYRGDVYKLLTAMGAAPVIHDMGISATPAIEAAANFAYLRFHGPAADYRGTYDLDVLQRRATYIGNLLSNEKTVYAYFNNTMGAAVFDALTLQELVTGRATF